MLAQQSSSGPRQREQDEQAAKRQQETNEQLRAIAADLRAIREKQAETEQRNATYEADQRAGVFDPPIWPNVAGVVIGTIASGIAIFTLWALKAQVKANVDAANAATKSANIQSHALMLQNRAYIYIIFDAWAIYRLKNEIKEALVLDDDACAIRLFIKNKGRMPATVSAIRDVVPSLNIDRVTEPDLIIEANDGWMQHEIPFNLAKMSKDEAAFMDWLYSPLEVTIAVTYADGFAQRTRQFTRRTLTAHTDNLDPTMVHKHGAGNWFHYGGTPMNFEIEHTKPAPDPEPKKKWWQKRLRWS